MIHRLENLNDGERVDVLLSPFQSLFITSRAKTLFIRQNIDHGKVYLKMFPEANF